MIRLTNLTRSQDLLSQLLTTNSLPGLKKSINLFFRSSPRKSPTMPLITFQAPIFKVEVTTTMLAHGPSIGLMLELSPVLRTKDSVVHVGLSPQLVLWKVPTKLLVVFLRTSPSNSSFLALTECGVTTVATVETRPTLSDILGITILSSIAPTLTPVELHSRTELANTTPLMAKLVLLATTMSTRMMFLP